MLFRYKALRLNEKGQRWQLFFKIFCFLNPSEVATDSVEGMFLFEQVSLKIRFSIKNCRLQNFMYLQIFRDAIVLFCLSTRVSLELSYNRIIFVPFTFCLVLNEM